MKIALVGYDVEGQASYRYFSSDPSNEIVIFDEADSLRTAAPEGVEVVAGSHALDDLRSRSFDKVVRTPGLSPRKLEGIANVTSATREFFLACPAPIIGVTGTKGKGTTAGLIDSILTAAGKKSWLVGNIGTPALDVIADISPDDVVVYELSSFQLWDLDRSPHVAVVLMIEPDHQDVHADMTDYLEAKSNIRRYQQPEDVCYYHPTNELSYRVAHPKSDWAEDEFEERDWLEMAMPYGVYPQVHVKENKFFVRNQPICGIENLRLPGPHNLENACAAIEAAMTYTVDDEAIAEGLRNFGGLPHRLKFVREVGGVSYYDDSIATTPGSAIAALKSFDSPKVLILGGSDKGVDLGGLFTAVANDDSVRQVVAIGKLAGKISTGLRAAGFDKVTELGMTTMPEVVAAVSGAAEPGDAVIMSPAAASFDMFRSYADRGEQFVAAVNALAE